MSFELVSRRLYGFATALVASALIPAVSAAETTREARSNDVASSYALEDDGDFFRIVGGNRCQITTDVADFKVSQHPDDAAVVYFVREQGSDADLYVLHNAEESESCPAAETVQILEDVAQERNDYQYHVVPNTDTSVVAVALGEGGVFAAWDDEDAVVKREGIEDYRLHNNYNVSGEPFRRYAAFAIDDDGRVFKVEGNEPGESSFHPNERYDDLGEFADAHLAD